MQIKGKLMNHTLENGEKPNFGPDFGQFGTSLGGPPQKIFSSVLPLLAVRHCHKLLLCAISKKKYDPNSRKWQKKLILGLI